jgi:hypothetical protein
MMTKKKKRRRRRRRKARAQRPTGYVRVFLTCRSNIDINNNSR